MFESIVNNKNSFYKIKKRGNYKSRRKNENKNSIRIKKIL